MFVEMPFCVPEPPKNIEPPLVSLRGARLATRLWFPASRDVKAIYLIVHGAGWHSGYYEGLAGRLNRDGILCAAYDQVCMGYSDPEPGTPQGYIHIRNCNYLVDDLFLAAEWAIERAKTMTDKELPFFLLGESSGGLQVLAAALDTKLQTFHGVKLKGVLTLGALLRMAPGLGPPDIVIKLLAILCPCFPTMKVPHADMSSTFDDAFGDKEWSLTARMDKAVMLSPMPTLATAISMQVCAERIASQAKSLKVPMLAIHAVKDCRADFGAVQKFVDQANAEGYWIEETTGHQLLQDRKEVTDRVKNKIAEWTIQQMNQF